MASAPATSPSFVLLLAASPKTLSLFTSKPTLSPPPAPLRPSHSQRRRSVRSASRKSTHLWRTRAASGDGLPAETTIEQAQQVIPAASDDGTVSTLVSGLLFFAFIVLSILTIAVIYLGVQDLLQKRERDKFEKEEAENKKNKGGKKGKVKVKARAGPRGFGQKIEEEEE